MRSILIADTTREERERIVAESIGNIDGVCDGCHLVQPPSVGQLVNANARNGVEGKAQSIVACTMCGRILYGEA